MSPDDEQTEYGKRLLAEAAAYVAGLVSDFDGFDESTVEAAWLHGFAAGCKASLDNVRKAVGMAPLPAPGSEALN